jgi:endoglucanase
VECESPPKMRTVRFRMRATSWLILPVSVLAAAACTGGTSSSTSPAVTHTPQSGSSATSPAGPNPALQLHVSGNKLVNANGNTVVLHGVDYSGTEYSCVQGKGIFAGPTDQASVQAMKSWGINAVRIPLNEGCWNGDSYVNPAFAGGNYRAAIKAYVRLLTTDGMVVILDLHWSDGLFSRGTQGCPSGEAVCEKPMPDAPGSVRFWSSVAQTFRGNDAVIFDLFNEPYPNRALPTEAAAWECWLKGGSACSPGIYYDVAGMQTLVDAVRATGANNVIMLAGLNYANDLTQWLRYEPSDPDHNLAASWHSYNFNQCNNQQCWNSQIAPVAAAVPVIAGEIGEKDCADDYIDPLMSFLDSQGASYLAWSWNANGNCAGGPQLITGYSGTPTPYGAGFRAHLQALADKP